MGDLEMSRFNARLFASNHHRNLCHHAFQYLSSFEVCVRNFHMLNKKESLIFSR